MTFRVAIIGGGPSGCAAAVALCAAAESVHSPIELTVFEKQYIYKGRALNTGDPLLLLNTSAGVSSIRGDNEDDFVSFLALRRPVDKADFASRTEAVAYIRQTMSSLDNRFSKIRVVLSEVQGIDKLSELNVGVRTEGSRYIFDAVVLAMGTPFKNLASTSSIPCISPYPVRQLVDVENNKSILIIGSHLSAIDVCVWLSLKRHQGPITILSRSGRLPAVRRSLLHSDAGNEAMCYFKSLAAQQGLNRLQCLGSVLVQKGGESIGRALKHRSTGFRNGAEEFNVAWQESELGPTPWECLMMSTIDTLNEEWPLTSADDRENFQKEIGIQLGRYISSMPLRNAQILAKMLDSGQLTLSSGGLDHAGIPFFVHGFCRTSPKHFDLIINATGMGRPVDDPFVANLASKNLVSINIDGGININPVTCKASSNLPIYALGPVVQGAIYTPNFLYSSVRSAQNLRNIIPNFMS